MYVNLAKKIVLRAAVIPWIYPCGVCYVLHILYLMFERSLVFMKKILFVAMMLLTMCGSCFARGGAEVLATEEMLADTVVASVIDPSVPYSSVIPYFMDESKQNFTESKLAEARDFLKSEFDGVKNFRFYTFNRRLDQNANYIGVDDIVMIGDTAKPNSKVVFVVSVANVKGTPKVMMFHIGPAGFTPAANK